MNSSEKKQIERSRVELTLKSMYFNRYLLVRYVTALFFFANLYWMIFLAMGKSSWLYLPLSLIGILLMGIAEQVKIYSRHTNNAKYTRFCYIAMIIANGILIAPTCIPSSFVQLYPFLANKPQSRIVAVAILIIGILLSILMLYRLNQIRHNADKQYQRIKEYEKAVNFH